MRELTSTLLEAQKQASAIPFVKVEAVNRVAGVSIYNWSRLYEGSEDEYYHALAVPADGSLNRFRVTIPTDSRKLYRQRVAAPGPESDFSQWTYTGQYNVVIIAAASLGAEVSLFWIKTNREIRRIKSTDYGATWDSPELLDYSPTTSVYGLAAMYKPNGDIAVFFTDQSTLYVKKCISGQWQTKAAWDRNTGELSSVACIYGNDWDLLVTGKDTAGNYKIWSLVYGDDGEVSTGTWSTLTELSSAPSAGNYQFLQPFLDKTDTYRCFFIEKFTGTEACNRPLWSHSVAGIGYTESLWREPVPFNLSSEYGLAMAHDDEYAWLSCANGVWRAATGAKSLDLTEDVIEIRQEVETTGGSLIVTLRNDDGRYALPAQGELEVLNTGYGLDFSPGYITTAGNEYSTGQNYFIESFEHHRSAGKANLVLYARDGWAALTEWRAKHQYRWNKSAADINVKGMISLILARASLKLEVISQSSVLTGFYPDFNISSGSDGRAVICKLLSYVPDLLFVEGGSAYVINPSTSDESVYSYGNVHFIREGIYHHGAMKVNHIQVEGSDAGSPVLADSFSWQEIDRLYDRFRQIEDSNISLVSEAQERGQAYLRQLEIEADSGIILVPVNCGQQLFDVIDITDIGAGFNCEKRRVLGMALHYCPGRGEYNHRLSLGAV